jgi:transketolase
MSALMEIPVTFILTHDSIGVGEDGPTHQPIEQLAGLRAMPNLNVYRPADGVETACAWANALKANNPSCFFLSRQTLKNVEGTSKDAVKGGYIVKDSDGKPDLILIGTGSELSLCDKARDVLVSEGYKVRLVSMPCVEDFEKQSKKYRESVLPTSVRKRVAVEAGSTALWYKYVGLDGKVIGIDRFGESAPAGKLFEKFGFTVDAVIDVAKSIL